MNDNVRKVFDILGIEPNEEFKIQYNEKDSYYIGETLYYIDENLIICNGLSAALDNRNWLQRIIVGEWQIVKLPKKKKLRDLTEEEYIGWWKSNCNSVCDDCPFNNVYCGPVKDKSWIKHKDLYSDKFLNQEIRIEEDNKNE